MKFFDTHCHIHSSDYGLDPDGVILSAVQAGVDRLLCVGTDLEDSQRAVEFVKSRENCWATIGLHPHEAARYVSDAPARRTFAALANQPKVVAVGETGLDYHYNHSSKADQQKILRFQLELALEHDLPLIFHVREAFDDFWPIFDDYRHVRGVVHSFSAAPRELDAVMSRGLYVGLNGIMTFTKQPEQIEAAKLIPLQKLLLETDAPYLTPNPYRGKICESKYVQVIASFLAGLRGERLEDLAAATTSNAKALFRL